MTTATAQLPTDVTKMPAGPDRLTIDPLHLCITLGWDSGSSHNIHMLENGDLGVILARGQDGRSGSHHVPKDGGTGTVVVVLGVDGDHDEVHFQDGGSVGDTNELLGQAIEALMACRQAVLRVERAGTDAERNAFEIGRDWERAQQAGKV